MQPTQWSMGINEPATENLQTPVAPPVASEAPLPAPPTQQSQPLIPAPPLPPSIGQLAWFARLFGLHPAIAFLTFILDLMLFGATWGSMFLLYPACVVAGGMLGYITYKAQMHWAGDTPESAKIKGLILGLLTALPVPLPAFLSIPSGLLGLMSEIRKR